jgi:hypothetical protein
MWASRSSAINDEQRDFGPILIQRRNCCACLIRSRSCRVHVNVLGQAIAAADPRVIRAVRPEDLVLCIRRIGRSTYRIDR